MGRRRSNLTEWTDMFRRLIVLVCAAVAAVVSLVGAGTASAKPYEAPRISQYSQDVWAVGGNSGCRGPIHVGIKVDRQQRGKAFITLTPRGFVGDGPGWKRNAICKVTIRSAVDFDTLYRGPAATVTAGPNGGKPVHTTMYPGSGLHALSFIGSGLSYFSSNYLVVP